ncbi:hypothetical protein QUF72_20870 [Desulfobacterales bacterium HSG2]|nr:hypothetical protein [Desulfobacterales bacterium HSG2]
MPNPAASPECSYRIAKSGPEVTKAVIPGRMSEAGFTENLVNPEPGFRHSDPESTHGNYGNPAKPGIPKLSFRHPKAVIPAPKAVIPGRMSEAGFTENLVNPEPGFRHSDPESIHGNYGNPAKPGIPKLSFRHPKAVIPAPQSCHSGQDVGSRFHRELG